MSVSTREAYGQALLDLADRYDYLVLDADLSKATQTVLFSKAHPDRFFNMGIAESNMMRPSLPVPLRCSPQGGPLSRCVTLLPTPS